MSLIFLEEPFIIHPGAASVFYNLVNCSKLRQHTTLNPIYPQNRTFLCPYPRSIYILDTTYLFNCFRTRFMGLAPNMTQVYKPVCAWFLISCPRKYVSRLTYYKKNGQNLNKNWNSFIFHNRKFYTETAYVIDQSIGILADGIEQEYEP